MKNKSVFISTEEEEERNQGEKKNDRER